MSRSAKTRRLRFEVSGSFKGDAIEGGSFKGMLVRGVPLKGYYRGGSFKGMLVRGSFKGILEGIWGLRYGGLELGPLV